MARTDFHCGIVRIALLAELVYAAVLKTDKTPQLLNGGGDMGSSPVQSTSVRVNAT